MISHSFMTKPVFVQLQPQVVCAEVPSSREPSVLRFLKERALIEKHQLSFASRAYQASL